MTVAKPIQMLNKALLYRRKSSSLSDVTERLERRLGKISLSGRYHRLPQRIEDEYVVSGTVLGTGYSGAVLMATRKGHPHQKYAVKALCLSRLPAGKLEQLKSEVENFLQMDHPHITRLHAVYESRDKLHLVMECMEGGELFDRVADLGKFGEQESAEAVYQMLLALNYLHSHGTVHRDVKLENFLYDKQGSSHLKLIDFGFSKMWDPRVEMEGSLGTIAYVAPEVLTNSYTSQCDLWSLGVITFILLSGSMPFTGNDQVMTRKIVEGNYTMKPCKWDAISPEATHFVRSLLDTNPRSRLTAQAALAHPWIAQRRRPATAGVDAEVVEALHQFGSLPKFRRCCMELIAWSLSNEERAKVREHFLSMDTSRRGAITLAELKQAMDTLGISDEEIQRSFAVLNTHPDQEIHYSDFLAAMVSTKIDLGEEMICSAFKQFDADGSGYIDAKDLRGFLGSTFEGEQVEVLLRDAVRSGQDRLSYPEFAAYLTGEPLSPARAAAAAAAGKPQPGKVKHMLSLGCAWKNMYSAVRCTGLQKAR